MDFERAQAINEAVRTLAMRHRAAAAQLLAPLRLHPGQEIVLLALADGPRTQGELAAISGCEPPTMTAIVRKLQTAGLLARCPSSTDRRVMVVTLSERGVDLLPQVRSAWQQLARRTVAELASLDEQQLPGVLAELTAGLERPC